MSYPGDCWKLLPLVLLLAGCDGAQMRQTARMEHFEANDGDFRLIAKASFDMIDPKKSITTIIAPPELDPRALAALKTIAKVVPTDRVPADMMPAGHFRVRTFSIDDGVAFLQGQLGPVTNAVTAAGLRDCGTIYTVPFELRGGDWASRTYKIETCAESRHWVPVDAGAKESSAATP